MPNVASVLKQEIARLARKQVMAATRRQSKQMRSLKATLRDLRAQVASLNHAVARLSKVTSVQLSHEQQNHKPAAVRVSPKSIRKHRVRLRLSQVEMAQLLRVSKNTVVLWEAGKVRPQGDNRTGLAQLRGLGVREARAMLESMKA